MSTTSVPSSKRILEPYDRISEVLFGLIMVLTFTGSLSVAEAGREDVRVMLIGAVGCNIAWGLIDAILYLMGCLAEKGRSLMTFKAVRSAVSPEKAHQLIAGALPPLLATLLQPSELESMRQRLQELPEPARPAKLDGSDWRGAVGVFLLVFLSTLPVSVPFLFIESTLTAMRVSNLVAIIMLFGTGVAFGRCVGRSPWGLGLAMVILGVVLVAITMALGG